MSTPIKEANYQKYYEKLEQARMHQALEVEKISNFSVVQAATYPVKPVWPTEILILALGLVLAVFGGVGLAFFSEFIDHTFKKPEDIKAKLQLTTLASIPRLGRKELVRRL